MSDMRTSPLTTRVGFWSVWRVLLVGQVLVSMAIWIGICLSMNLPATPSVDVTFFSLLVWKCEMLGFWAGLGRSRRRFAVILLAAPSLGLVASYPAFGSERTEFQIFCLGVFSVVALTTGLLRWFAGSLQRAAVGGAERDALRFSIHHVMIWTAVLAVVFGVFRYLVQLGVGAGGVRGLFSIGLLAVCMSFCTVGAVWAILGTRILPSRLIGMLLVMGFAVAMTHVLSHEWMFTSATTISQILMWLTLGLLRLDGYRFLKPQPA